MKFVSLSVIAGWQTAVVGSNDALAPTAWPFGPAFNDATDLWAWQQEHLPEDDLPLEPFTSVKDLISLLYRAAAALETPSDLAPHEINEVVEDLKVAARGLEGDDRFNGTADKTVPS